MSKLIWMFAITATASCSAFADPELKQSDTVPTSVLEAYYAVYNSETPNNAQALVELKEATVVNGVEEDVPLAQSSDDVVTISTGKTTIIYDPNDTSPTANLLPLARKGGIYRIKLTRATGEVFESSVQFPGAVVITTPAPNSVVSKNTEVDVLWKPVKFYGEQALIEYSGCEQLGDDQFLDNGFRFEKNFAALCEGPLKIRFTYTPYFYGKGYGSSVAFTFGTVDFSYDKASSLTHPLSNREKALRLINSRLSPRALIMIKH